MQASFFEVSWIGALAREKQSLIDAERVISINRCGRPELAEKMDEVIRKTVVVIN